MSLSHIVVLIVCLTAPAVFADPAPPPDATSLATDAIALQQDVDNLVNIGQQSFEARNYDGALDALQEAQYLIHRAYGVHAPEQAAVVELMSQVYLAMGKVQATTRLRKFKLTLFRRQFGDNDARLAPFLMELGDWLQLSAQYADARTHYSEALALLASVDAPGYSLVRPATSLAYTDYLDGRCCQHEPVERVVAGLQHDQSADSVEKSMAMLMAGDLFLMEGDTNAAGAHYQMAGQVLPGTPENPVLLGVSSSDRMARAYRETMTSRSLRQSNRATKHAPIPPGKLIGAPLPFCEARINDLSRRQDYHDYVIKFELTIKEDGRVRGLSILESNATAQVNLLAARMYALARFRPRLENGVPVSQEIELTQRFDVAATLDPTDLPFPPANLAVFHGCFGLADTR